MPRRVVRRDFPVFGVIAGAAAVAFAFGLHLDWFTGFLFLGGEADYSLVGLIVSGKVIILLGAGITTFIAVQFGNRLGAYIGYIALATTACYLFAFIVWQDRPPF